MNQIAQIAHELISKGHTIPADVAQLLMQAGYDVQEFQDAIDGYDVIDPTDVDYFEYIDQNH